MVLAELASSLGFLSDLELLGGNMLRRARFVSLFCFIGGGLGSFLEISLLRVRDGRLHPLSALWLGRNFVTRFDLTGFIDLYS